MPGITRKRHTTNHKGEKMRVIDNRDPKRTVPPSEAVVTVDAERMISTEINALTATDGMVEQGDVLMMHSENIEMPRGIELYVDRENPLGEKVAILNDYHNVLNAARSMDSDLDREMGDLEIAGAIAVGLAHLFFNVDEIEGKIPDTDAMATINNPKQYRISYPAGSFAQVLQIAPFRWRVQISSGKARDQRINVTRMVDGTKGRALMALGLMAYDGLRLRKHIWDTLMAAVNQYRPNISGRIVTVEDVYPKYRNIVHLTHTHTNGFFEKVYEILATGPAQLEEMGIYGNTADFAYKTEATLENFFGEASPPNTTELAKAQPPYYLDRWELSQLTIALIHDFWYHIQATHHEKMFEEMTAIMAKNSGQQSEKVWFFIEGGETSVNKLTNTLQSNRHEVVRDTSKAVYLNVQFNEKKFVEGVVKRFNCHMALIAPPEYGVAICGVKSTQVDRHQIRCNSCKRERLNQEARERKAAADIAAAEAEVATQKAARANLQAVKNEPAVPSSQSPDGVYKSGVGTTYPQNPIIPPAKKTPAQEVAENQSKNGPVKVITNPDAKLSGTSEKGQETAEKASIVLTSKLPDGMDTNDLQATADYYAKLSDEHQTAATYYENLAIKMYEFLQEPEEPEEVRLAREALERATAEATQQRAVQFDELKALLTGD